jgi:hypothetical protein
LDLAHDFVQMSIESSFIWLPIVFAAYVLGRKTVGLKFLLLLTVIELLAIMIAL